MADLNAPVAPTYFEDFDIGMVFDLGETHFSAEDIIRFAEKFDPQPFHVSDERARETHFGRLCASGWHTGSAWMAAHLKHYHRWCDQVRESGGVPGELGVSPGIKNMTWKRPVYAGDTIRFSKRVTDKRLSRAWPDWGMLFHQNEAHNQDGNAVMTFEACIFIKRRMIASD